MPSVVKSLVLFMVATMAAAETASAWERAPIEYATRSARPTSFEAVRAPAAAVTAAPTRQRAVAASMDQHEILYGYGNARNRSERAPLDLRGTLRGPTVTVALADDAFDELAPSMAPAASAAPPQANEQQAVDQAATSATPSPSVDVAPTTSAETSPARDAYFVQVGAFANPANAERVREALQDVGSVTIDQRQGASVTLHRVRLGQWPTRAAAELACDMIVERGFAGAVVSEGR